MRVAHFVDIASVGETLVTSLSDLGVDARLIAPSEPGGRLGRPARALTFPLRMATLLAAGVRLRGGDFDIVHAHYAWKALAAIPAGRPLVVHCHGTDVRGVSPDSRRGRVLATLLPRARRVYMATPDLERWVRPMAPRATFLPNPIDTMRFRPGQLPASRDLLVGVRLDPVKGLDAVVEAIHLVTRARPETTITIVAQGSGIEAAVRAAGTGAILVPLVPRAALPTVYQAHRVALGQASVGAIGNYELEALACGVPVAADFRYPGAYAAAPPLLPFDSPTAAAAALVSLLDDEPRRAAVATDGRRWVTENHAADRVARRLLVDYEEILRLGG